MMNFISPSKISNPLKEVLIQSFDYTRQATERIVEGLSVEELDFVIDIQGNSTGTLLKHIAALEYFYQQFLFEKRHLTPNEREFWNGAMPKQLYKKLIKGNAIHYYLDLMREVRSDTRKYLSSITDSWLFEQSGMDDRNVLSNYSWLFHLIEDEMNHLGQIKLTILRYKKQEMNL